MLDFTAHDKILQTSCRWRRPDESCERISDNNYLYPVSTAKGDVPEELIRVPLQAIQLLCHLSLRPLRRCAVPESPAASPWVENLFKISLGHPSHRFLIALKASIASSTPCSSILPLPSSPPAPISPL
ncbi:hypothetical protein E2C01_043596 [Portunus trituberculatus]|uniref:Uncharacterized protein n=1 Tax=Portunus trituberculatus TaxID=210409 RepID=A0A5B7FTC9_PORTR|nr:hypothetical protein [Portunus trituberculatus]